MVTRFTNGFLSCVQYRLRTKSSFLKFKRRHWKTIKLLIRAETQSNSNESGFFYFFFIFFIFFLIFFFNSISLLRRTLQREMLVYLQ